MDRTLAVATLVVLAAAAPLQAAPARPRPAPAIERAAADLLPAPAQLRLSRSAKAASAAAAPTLEDVGDVDSFGRAAIWLGVTNGFVTLAPACPPSPAPGEACKALSPSPATTSFAFDDLARISLPGKATHSLLCYWLSPYLTVNYQNSTAAPVVARLAYSPTLTVENPVLDDPALIDPGTGAPFGGRLQTSMTASENLQVPLPAGASLTERTRDSAVCIAGFLSRRTLVDQFGLSDAQATEFFKKPTTVRLNVRGSAQHVANATLVFGLRILGD